MGILETLVLMLLVCLTGTNGDFSNTSDDPFLSSPEPNKKTVDSDLSPVNCNDDLMKEIKVLKYKLNHIISLLDRLVSKDLLLSKMLSLENRLSKRMEDMQLSLKKDITLYMIFNKIKNS